MCVSYYTEVAENVPVGQKCRTSGVHFSGMFSSESGLSIEKHMSMTSVSG